MSECISHTAARSQKWDILKFLLIFLVVLGHAADFYKGTSELMLFLRIFIYLFHMPLFIFISGLFSKKTVNEKRYYRLTGYIAVYLVLKLFEYYYKLLSRVPSSLSLLSPGGSQWFMLALFSFNLITMAVKNISPRYVMSLAVVLSCACGMASDINDFFALSRTIVFFPFFYLGYLTDRARLEEFCTGRNKKIISAVVLSAIAVIFYVCRDGLLNFLPLFSGRYPFSLLGFHPEFGFLYRLLYYPLVLLTGLCIIVLIPNKTKSGLAARLGQRTLAVYGFHYIVFYFMYVRFDCRPFFERLLGDFSVIIPIVASVAATLFFSLGFFGKALNFIMNVPLRSKKPQ